MLKLFPFGVLALFFRGELLGSVFSFGLTWLVTSSGALHVSASDFLDSSRWFVLNNI